MIFELPKLICKFDNYTQSVDIMQLIIYLFACIGLFYTLFFIYGFFRTGSKK